MNYKKEFRGDAMLIRRIDRWLWENCSIPHNQKNWARLLQGWYMLNEARKRIEALRRKCYEQQIHKR